MQQDSDWLLIAASHSFSCCVKRSTSESVTRDVRKEGKRAFAPIEIWFKTKNVWKTVQFRLISLILAIAVYLPVWRCTRRRFAALLSWSLKLAVYSCSLLHLQMQVAKLVSGLFDRYSLVRNNNMATWLQRFSQGRRRFAHVTVERKHLWQKMLRDSHC